MLGNCALRAPSCRTGSRLQRTHFTETLSVCSVSSARLTARWEGSSVS